MFRLIMILSLVLIVAGGCVSVTYTQLGDQQYHPVDSAGVQVFMSAADVPGKFEKIGLLTASAGTNTNDKAVVDAMVEKAGENGADGIILGQFNNPDALTQVAGALLHFTTLMKAQAVAIRFLDALGFMGRTAPAAAQPAPGTVPVFVSPDGTLKVKIYDGGHAYLFSLAPGENYNKPVFLSDYAQSAQFLPGPGNTPRVLLTLASGSTMMFDSKGIPVNTSGN
jgi:hypothetical protein